MADRPLQRTIAARAQAQYLVRPEHDREELGRLLDSHRPYAAYAIGQLQPALFARSEWWVSRGAEGQALLLHSQGGLGNALFTLGSSEALDAVLRLHPGPRHTFLTCQPHQLDVASRYYRLTEQGAMLRMLVDGESLQSVDGDTLRLSGRHAGQANQLYRSDGTPAFYSAANIDDAVYFGAFADDRLVAVAGTHVVSEPDEIAVAGNIFTHPAYRGQGFATLVIAAVTKELLKSCREVVLSVDPQNEQAVRAYRRVGYREVDRLIEGAATRRGLGFASTLARWLAAVRGRRYGAELVDVTRMKGRGS